MRVAMQRNLIDAGDRWRLHLDEAFTLPDLRRTALLHKGPHSRILRIEGDPEHVAKLVFYRSRPRDNLRKYINCQALREFRSAQIMARLGLAVPPVHGYGFSLSPFGQYESLLFMRRLGVHWTGMQTMRRSGDTSVRHSLLDRMASGLAAIYGNGYHHKDIHFANVILNERNTLMWIDNDIRRPRRLAALRRGLEKSLALLESTGQRCLHTGEWHYFRDAFNAELRRQPQGRHLA